MNLTWITWLRHSHPSLYQQFLADEEAAEQAERGTRFIAINAVYQQWQRRVDDMLMGGAV